MQYSKEITLVVDVYEPENLLDPNGDWDVSYDRKIIVHSEEDYNKVRSIMVDQLGAEPRAIESGEYVIKTAYADEDQTYEEAFKSIWLPFLEKIAHLGVTIE